MEDNIFKINPEEFLKDIYFKKISDLAEELKKWRIAYYKLSNDYSDATVIIEELHREIERLKSKMKA